MKKLLFILCCAFPALQDFVCAAPPVSAGLRLWLEADVINTADAQQVVTVNGVPYVKNWRDQSGNGLDAIQNSNVYQPLYIAGGLNGKAILRFDGANDFLATALAQVSGDKSIFVVQRRTTTNGGKEISSAAGTGFFLGCNPNAPGNTETKGRIGVAHDFSLMGTLNGAILKSLIRSADSETLRVGDSAVSGTVVDVASNNYTISSASSPFAGDVAEVLIYNRALTSGERQTVESYLKAKWNLYPVTVPVTSGLQLWLDATAINAADATQVVPSGGLTYVKDWRDLSTNNLHATQTVAGALPLYVAAAINGKPAVRFDGIDDFLTTALPQISGDKTVFLVHDRTSTVVGTEISSDQGLGMFLGNDEAAETKGRLWIAHDLSLPGSINGVGLKCYLRNGSNETLCFNDASVSASIPDGAEGNYTISGGEFPFAGDIAEVIIYNRALTDTERQSVTDYLKAKWSIYGPPPPVTNGLQLQLDASAINSNDSNRARTTNGNTYVKDWLDRSPNGSHVTQPTATYQPSYVPNALNGRPVVRFNGANTFMTSPLGQISGDKSIFVVQKRNSTTSGKEISSSASTGNFLGNNVGLETKGRIGVGHDLSLTGNLNYPILKSFIRSGTSETLRVDYNSVSSLPPDLANGTYTLSSQTSPFAGDIAEVLIYNRALPDSDRTLVEGYLREKWAASKFSVPVTTGLSLWLDASAIDPSDANQVSNSNGNLAVANWFDRSVNSRRASQPVTTLRPLYVSNALSGRPVVRFNGTNSFMYTNLPQMSGDKSMFVVQRRTSASLGTEISSSGASGKFFANYGTDETAGRLNIAHDLLLPGGLASPILKSLIRSGTSETLRVGNAATTNIVPDSAGGNFTLSSSDYPFGGDITEVLIYNRALTNTERQAVESYLNSKWYLYPLNDIRSILPDLAPVPMSLGAVFPGVRVKQTSPEYANTSIYHTLYLPTDWESGRKFPVIVEFAPNTLAASDNNGIGVSGKVEDTVIGYGATRGKGFIWVSMPIVSANGQYNETSWWGNLTATKDYCVKTVRRICEDYGGDPSAVIVCGFSRGSIGCDYIGLSDDSIADVWLASICHAHYDGQITSWPYPDADAASALTRLQRLRGRHQFISNETTLTSASAYLQSTGVDMTGFRFNTLPFVNHCDIWALRPVQLREDLRTWLQLIVANRPGTHSISGRVTDAAGNPIANARIDSGYTHFTTTDNNGNYVLAGLIDSNRTVTVTANGYSFTGRSVTVAGSDVNGVDFHAGQ